MERSGPLSSVSCKSSQIVAAVSGGSNDGSVLVPVCEAVYFAMYSDVPPRRAAPRRDYSIAPAVRTLRFNKIAFEARNDAASRKDLSLESLPLVGTQDIHRRKNSRTLM